MTSGVKGTSHSDLAPSNLKISGLRSETGVVLGRSDDNLTLTNC